MLIAAFYFAMYCLTGGVIGSACFCERVLPPRVFYIASALFAVSCWVLFS